jgi:DNA-binding MarR family transcriptional regulator
LFQRKFDIKLMVMENLEQREIGRSGVYPHRYMHLRNPALRAWVRMLRLSQKVQPADALLVTKGNMTYHLCRMAERGLVDRRPEGRKNRLYLTGEGRRLLEEALPEHEALIDERFAGLSVEDRAQLADLLKNLDCSQP